MRHKDQDWDLKGTTHDDVMVAVLMDLRDELKEIRRRLQFATCPNFLAVPAKLDRIVRNTTKKRRCAVKKAR